MLSSGSAEKNSTALADNSQTRGNFAVGINPLGDESQQNIRIQLAVHRYNNCPGSAFVRPISDRSSPFKHGFLKTSQKYKNYENDKEEVHSGLKKSHNQYQDVGSFPIVHLKKNISLGKPVKSATVGEFKIQLPELPFNRFLSHSPDICLDTKTSTRSVLDVLQDLSRKRIHTKDDTEASKRKCKGLGGDSPLDFEAPFKPLFVTKCKSNIVTYKDSMTQTLDVSHSESINSKKSDIILNNEKNDPKAELRRKLARQNNEIFASLSSSTLTYPLKRGSEKISVGKNDMKQIEPKTKRTKYFSVENNGKNMQNGGLSSKELTARNSVNQLDKVEKKQKDSNKISPNKDRLTAIFIEMQNVNPKLEVLSKNKITDEKENQQSSKAVELNAEKRLAEKCATNEGNASGQDKLVANSGVSVSFEPSNLGTNVSSSPPVDANKMTNDKAVRESNIFGLSGPGAVTVTKEVPINEKNNMTSIITTSAFILPMSSGINFGFSPESSNFKIPVASTISSSLTQTPIFSTGILQKANSSDMNSPNVKDKVNDAQEKVQNTSSVQISFSHSVNQGLLFNPPSSVEGKNESQEVSHKPNTSNLFNFGIGEGSQNQALPKDQTQSSGTNTNEDDNALKNSGNQPSNDAGTHNVTSSVTLINGFSSETVQTSSSITSITTTVTSTTLTQSQQSTSFFTFSDKTSNLGNQASEKSSTLPFTFGQASNSMPPQMFGTGSNVSLASKPEVQPAKEEKSLSNDSANQESSKQVNSALFNQNNFPTNSFTSTTQSFGQNVGISSPQNNKNTVPFKFGEKTDSQNVTPNTENSLASTGSNLFDKKPQSGVFSFGQKPATQDGLQLPTTQSPVSQTNLFQSNVFTFGQKSSAPVTTSQVNGNSGLFGQNPSAQTSLFQQNVSQPSATMSNSLLSSSSPFGISSQANLNEKNQIPSFIQTTSSAHPMNNSFTQNKLSHSLAFGGSTSSFGQGSSSSLPSETNIFGSNTPQNAPAFGTGSAVQNIPFSQPFGDNSNKQQNGNNTGSNFFLQSSTTQSSGFGQNAVFGSNTFGQNTTENNIFCQKTQVGGFEQNQNVQSSPFGQSSVSQTFGSQAPFTFGAPPTTSTSSNFTLNPSTAGSVFTFGNSTKTTTASTSNFGFSSNSQPSSSSQSPFTFNSQSMNNPFKFGSGTASTPGSTGSFPFDSNPSTSEASKAGPSVFNFGSSQSSSQNTGFNFGATQSPVFSFGDSTSTTNNTPKFSFGAAQSTPGMFTPGVTPSPSMPGLFSIGSGSNQPRSRNTSTRARRRT